MNSYFLFCRHLPLFTLLYSFFFSGKNNAFSFQFSSPKNPSIGQISLFDWPFHRLFRETFQIGFEKYQQTFGNYEMNSKNMVELGTVLKIIIENRVGDNIILPLNTILD